MDQIMLAEHGVNNYTTKLIESINQGYSVVPNTSRVRGSLFTCTLTREGGSDAPIEVEEDEDNTEGDEGEEGKVENENFFSSMTKKKIVEYIKENYDADLDDSVNKETLVKDAVKVVWG